LLSYLSVAPGATDGARALFTGSIREYLDMLLNNTPFGS
jgi:hypothetical protein